MTDWMSNEEIKRNVGLQNKLSGRLEKCVLIWFGNVERMDDGRMAKRVYDSEVPERRGRGRVWMD